MALLILLLSLPLLLTGQAVDTPNIVLIITDDQGYGDLGITGNHHVKSPVLDELASASLRFNNFYVSPVCAPTRASLLTGRYSLRTGIRDTYNGGAIMAGNEETLAELLKKGNYKSGIFGKWHLGDNYPSRPTDQGFDESLVHLSGGMGQVGDFTTWFAKDRSYFDPVLWHNNKKKKYEGYCSDIFADNAIEFIEKNKAEKFFCYLSFNAPHTPLQVPDKYYQMYKEIDPSAGFEDNGMPLPVMSEKDKEDARKVYAMVSNIDDNIGKLLNKLENLDLTENTLVIFMTDNGPQQLRYVAGMKGSKGSVYRGGVRVPFYLKYPKKFEGNRDIDIATAHIDILPTLAEICNLPLPDKRKIDGKSLVPLLEGKSTAWEERPLFFYWSRKYPELYNGMALQKGKNKLVAYADYNAAITDFEFYDLEKDPYELHNIIDYKKEQAKMLKNEMSEWHKELVQSINIIKPQRIVIGAENENPIFLNRNDASGARGIWDQEEVHGKWQVKVIEGIYNVRFRFIKAVQGGGRMFLESGTTVYQAGQADIQTDVIEMKKIRLGAGEYDLIPFYMHKGRRIFPFWVELERIN